MKTAMQILIDHLNTTLSLDGLSRGYKEAIDDACDKATELLEKEKEEIVNAYSEGNRNGLNNKALGANKYYRETYNT